MHITIVAWRLSLLHDGIGGCIAASVVLYGVGLANEQVVSTRSMGSWLCHWVPTRDDTWVAVVME